MAKKANKSKKTTKKNTLKGKAGFPNWAVVVIVLMIVGLGIFLIYNSYAATKSNLGSTDNTPVTPSTEVDIQRDRGKPHSNSQAANQQNPRGMKPRGSDSGGNSSGGGNVGGNKSEYQRLMIHWGGVVDCESGGNFSINTGNGYYGGLQFDLSTWRSVGGQGYPHQASALEQLQRAEQLRQSRGLSPWPVCGQRYR